MGTGVGGANTNYYGKKFEEKNNNQQRNYFEIFDIWFNNSL